MNIADEHTHQEFDSAIFSHIYQIFSIFISIYRETYGGIPNKTYDSSRRIAWQISTIVGIAHRRLHKKCLMHSKTTQFCNSLDIEQFFQEAHTMITNLLFE